MLYRPSTVVDRKAGCGGCDVKDPAVASPNHQHGMDIEQPAGNSLHQLWEGQNPSCKAYIKILNCSLRGYNP